jgi:branched-chain amino acid transport system ATP-binding protein
MGNDALDVLLRVRGLAAGYGRLRVIDNIDFEVSRGDIVAVIGHNGSGKTTLLKALFGLTPVLAGSIDYTIENTRRELSPTALRNSGAALVLQGNRVFGRLRVLDQLKLAVRGMPDSPTLIERALNEFPILRTRLRSRTSNLSGGERQILALAAAFARSPQLLMLDEPTSGLSPILAREILSDLRKRLLGTRGAAIIVEHKVKAVLDIANRVYVLARGRVSFCGSAESLRDESMLRRVYLGGEESY